MTRMAGAAPWQLDFELMVERSAYLRSSGQWSDCKFIVGSEDQEVVPGHKLILAMTSPVFETMFYGGLSARNETVIPIPDVQPDAFRALLDYIYTGIININSIDLAWKLWYAAKKYMLPHLVQECRSYISKTIGPKNACKAYDLARFFEDKLLMDICIKIITIKTMEALNDSSFEDVSLNTVTAVLSLDTLNVNSELDLFHAVVRYAKAHERNKEQSINPPVDVGPSSEKTPETVTSEKKVVNVEIESSAQNRPAAELDLKKSDKTEGQSDLAADIFIFKEEKPIICAAIQKIRFLTLTSQQFAEGPACSTLLSEAESFAVLMNIASTDSVVPMPTRLSSCRVPRQKPKLTQTR